jgi:hypothetical protein
MSTVLVTTKKSEAIPPPPPSTRPSSTSSSATSGTFGSNSAAKTATQSSQNALSQLSRNFNDFLNMLMTQLQNQDPTSPMDTNQFTSELVEFRRVEPQINANTSLTQLIQLTEAADHAGLADGREAGGRYFQPDPVAERHRFGAVHRPDRRAGGDRDQQFERPAGARHVADSDAGQNTGTWNGTDNKATRCPVAPRILRLSEQIPTAAPRR